MGLIADLRTWLAGDWRRASAPVASIQASAGNDLNGTGDFGGGWQTIFSGTAEGTFGKIGVRDAMSLPAVLRAAETLSGVFAMTPIKYYRRTPSGPVPAEDSPLYRLFHDRPNDVQSPFLFKEVALGDMLFAGRFAPFVHRDERFQPHMLSRLDPYRIRLATSWSEADGQEVFYDAALPDGSQRRLTRAECWYVPGFSRDGLTGFDRIALMQTALDGARATSNFASRYWSNMARPDVALVIPGKADRDAKRKMRDDWQALYGNANYGAPAVVDQGVTVQELKGANRDAQFIEARQFGVLEVARAFGVPPHLLFELSRATFSNIEQQSLEFIIYCMGPHYARFQEAATFYFAEPGHYFEFVPEALLKGDIKSRYEAYGVAIDKGIMNPNTVRRKENMPDRDGGDTYRMGSGSTIEGATPPSPVPQQA